MCKDNCNTGFYIFMSRLCKMLSEVKKISSYGQRYAKLGTLSPIVSPTSSFRRNYLERMTNSNYQYLVLLCFLMSKDGAGTYRTRKLHTYIHKDFLSQVKDFYSWGPLSKVFSLVLQIMEKTNMAGQFWFVSGAKVLGLAMKVLGFRKEIHGSWNPVGFSTWRSLESQWWSVELIYDLIWRIDADWSVSVAKVIFYDAKKNHMSVSVEGKSTPK